MTEREFKSMGDLVSSFFNALEKAEHRETKNNDFKVNYESSQEDLIKRLREQNKKYFVENGNLDREVKTLSEALKNANARLEKIAEENRDLALENQKYASNQKKLVEENKSLKGGPYNKDFYISIMSNLGRKIVDEYVLWLNLCKALKLEDTEMYDDINDDMYDKIPE